MLLVKKLYTEKSKLNITIKLIKLIDPSLYSTESKIYIK